VVVGARASRPREAGAFRPAAAASPPVPALPQPATAGGREGASPAKGLLESDPRLQVRVTVRLFDARFQDLLDLVGERTGVPLSAGPPGQLHEPVLQGIDMHEEAAWKVLVQASAANFVGGEWTRQGNGYQFEGGGPRSFARLRRPPRATAPS
jgi:hypothetical protein